MPSSRGSSQPKDWTQVSHIAGRFFTVWATREASFTHGSIYMSMLFSQFVPPSPSFLCAHICSLHLHLYPCSANRFICAIFSYSTYISSFSSVAQSCPVLCNLVDCSMPGFPVHHHHLEIAQTHVHQISNAIQPSHLLSSHTLTISSWNNLVKIPGNEAFLTAAKGTAPGLPGSNNKETYIHEPHRNITKLLIDTGAPIHMLLDPA